MWLTDARGNVMAELDVRDDWFKALLVGAPLFASSLAITYDVGFFFGANMGFFTFFSLSEHVVFALQAIPFVLAPALGIIGMIGVTWFGYHKTIKNVSEVMEKVQQMRPDERETLIAKLTRRIRFQRLIDPIVQGGFFTCSLWLFANHHYTSALLILVSQVVAKMVYPVERWESKHFRYALSLFCILAGLAVAFTVGYERSDAIISSKEPTERISVDEKQIAVRLIRGGERGLLFKSFETGKLGFLRWEKIKQIDSL
jgi:hypothetical protein